MSMTSILHRGRPVAILVVAMLLLTPVLAMAQTEASDFEQGKADGKRDSKTSAWWLAAGCAGILGFIYAATAEPSVPQGSLIGKSAEYVTGYNEGYKAEGKHKQMMYAGIGCAIEVVVWVALVAASDDSDL